MEALGVRAACAACVVLFGMMVEGSRESRARQRTLCCAALPHRVLAPAFRCHRYEGEAHDRLGLTSARPGLSHDRRLETACPFGVQRCLLSAAHGSCPELQRCHQTPQRPPYNIQETWCALSFPPQARPTALQRDGPIASAATPRHCAASGGRVGSASCRSAFMILRCFFSSEIRLTLGSAERSERAVRAPWPGTRRSARMSDRTD